MKFSQVTKCCDLCGQSFSVKKYRAESARYCSKQCWSKRSPPVSGSCAHCGSSFVAGASLGQRFCSRSCSRKSMVGPRATAWKGGKAAHIRRAAYRGDLAKWRRAVFVRDGWACTRCGSRGILHAHHIKPLAQYPALALDVSNGIALCVPCHEAEHGRKIASPARFKKHCAKCGASTSGRSLFCRPCSIRSMWKARHDKSTGVFPVAS